MVITLTTDFGYKDPFVGVMKGIIAGINPAAQVVDLSHGVAPQDVMGGALILRFSTKYFPRGTIHVAVVDPGVGSARRPILIESAGNYLIGPDNGVLSLAVDATEPVRVIHLCNPAYHHQPLSATFHGRDIFAPSAAHLSLDMDAGRLGNPLQDFLRIAWPEIESSVVSVCGEIVYIDIFGNLITNVSEADLRKLPATKVTVHLHDLVIHGLATNYAAGQSGDYIALINSWGLLEIAIYRGNAQERCGARIGDRVAIRAQ
jgi:S-adenosylmethionine hydrolase